MTTSETRVTSDHPPTSPTPHLAIYCDPRVVLVAVLPDLVQGPRLTRRTELSPSLSRARAQLGAGPMPLLLLLLRRCLRMVFSIDCSVRTGCPLVGCRGGYVRHFINLQVKAGERGFLWVVPTQHVGAITCQARSLQLAPWPSVCVRTK